MGRLLPVAFCVALLFPACGPSEGGPSPTPGTGPPAPPGPIDAGAHASAPSDAWTLAVAADGTSRWTDASGQERRRVADSASPPLTDLRIAVGEETPWHHLAHALQAARGDGAPTLWFETGTRTVRIPTASEETAGARPSVLLEVRLRSGAEGALGLSVSADGQGWWDREGCEAPARAEWPWRGAPDGELAVWLARASEAAGHDPKALAVRVRGEGAASGAPATRDLLDLLLAVLDARVTEVLDVGIPGPSAGHRRAPDAVEHDLRWLATHQEPDGRWSGATWGQWCDGVRQARPRPGDAGADADVGATGAALCVFLGAGYTHRGDIPFARCVRAGLKWLRSLQDPSGLFSPSPAEHAWAALAMIEAYGMTESTVLGPSAKAALQALLETPRGTEGEPRSLFLRTMGIVSARLIREDAVLRKRQAPWEIPPQIVADLLVDLARLDARQGPLARAVSLTGRLLLGIPADVLREDVAALPLPGTPEAPPDPTYAWVGTLATYRLGGTVWKVWEQALVKAVLQTQRPGAPCCYGGSWDLPPGVLLPGGRVEATALHGMSMAVFYRYDRPAGIR